MLKKVFLFAEVEDGKRIFRLMERVAGKPVPAADSQIRKGVVDKSENIGVLADSILRIMELTGDSVEIESKPPEGFDPDKFFPLSGAELLVVREKLGLSPG